MDIHNTSYTFFNSQVAFYCLLKAFGIGNHDRVLIPGYTSSFIPQTVCHTAATPEYADIDPENYTSLIAHYKETYQRMQSNGTASVLTAVLIHHTYGSPNPDTEEIVNWAKEKGLLVIEYCAYGPQLAHNGKALGTSGDGAFFTFGSQGIAQVNNSKYLNIMAAMEKVAPPPTKTESFTLVVNHIMRQLLIGSRYCRLASQYFTKSTLLFDLSRWQECLEASPRDFFKGVGRIQRSASTYYAKRFDTIISHKKQLAVYYNKLLKARGLPIYNYDSESILSYYPVRVKNKQDCLSIAKALGLEMGQGFDYPLYAANDDTINWDESVLHNALSAAQEVVCLPLHEQITLPYAEQLVNLLDCLAKGTTADNTKTPLKLGCRIPYVSALLERIGKVASRTESQY